MVSHNWSDESVDWSGIHKAAQYIGRRLLKWRIGVRQYKEKWGTVRVYCSLGCYRLHDLTHPGHCFSRYPKWLWRFDIRYGGYIMWPLNQVLLPLHRWIYRNTYKKAVQKWPHLREEILCAADWDELLKGL
tara:strand:+ start:31 stop:423 length:393 start_codon:yes stop_codon:yes gene_type:complete